MNLRDLQLFATIENTAEYRAIDQMMGAELALTLFDRICSSYKNIAFQSLAMQLGLFSGDTGTTAFETGARLLIACKDIGLYKLKSNETSVWVQPVLQFDEAERYLLDPMNFETHDAVDPVFDNEGIILSKFSQHDYPLNYEFLNKINKVPFELDMDILLNFSGENMPITYNQVTAEYLGKEIRFKWDYDSRGRSYSKGYGLNIQGNKTVRSVIQFKNKEVIKDIDPLYIALANARGFDGWTWERRIAWAKKQPVTSGVIVPKDTKYPEKYVKAIQALIDYENGTPSGFMMELDATASGIQLMACITGCEKTALETNLINPNKRKCPYRGISQDMNKAGLDTTTLQVKYPCMTHYYNSTETPRKAFTAEELEMFYECLDGRLPGAELAKNRLNQCWNASTKAHKLIYPDGHTMFFRTMTAKEGLYDYNDIEVAYKYFVNEGNKTSYRCLVPNIIHGLDGYVARQMVLRATCELVHVHDCFLFHPNYFGQVKQLYREILAELVIDFNINHIIKGLTGVDPQIYVNPSLADKILLSSYALS